MLSAFICRRDVQLVVQLLISCLPSFGWQLVLSLLWLAFTEALERRPSRYLWNRRSFWYPQTSENPPPLSHLPCRLPEPKNKSRARPARSGRSVLRSGRIVAMDSSLSAQIHHVLPDVLIALQAIRAFQQIAGCFREQRDSARRPPLRRRKGPKKAARTQSRPNPRAAHKDVHRKPGRPARRCTTTTPPRRRLKRGRRQQGSRCKVLRR